MARMLDLAKVLQLVIHRFNQRSLLQQNLVHQFDQALLHVLFRFGHQLQATLVEFLKQLLRDVAPVTEKLPEQTLRHFWHWFTVIRVGRGELEGQQLAALVDDQMQLEAKLPACRAFPHPTWCLNTLWAWVRAG